MGESLNLNPETEPHPMERAVVLLKPGYLEYTDRLVDYLRKKDLVILDQKVVRFDAEMATDFYPHAAVAIERTFGPEEFESRMKIFIDYITGDDAIALLLEGDDAIQKVNRVRDKVRSWFHLEKPADAIHASGNCEEAEREAAVLNLGSE